ncbi:MAG: hypothetical protein KF794_11905 [Xanthobacteraceae bacterium]|nr:MAG: hypothetical protein KF794_11905 [Xanthobacteraceae bacterium]
MRALRGERRFRILAGMLNRTARNNETGSKALHAGEPGGALFPVHPLLLAAICTGAFAVYWASSFLLDARQGTIHFGADTLDYWPLAEGGVNPRNVRLHLLTIILSLTWMALTKPLALWLELEYLHRALYALIGALGVWAALSAFAALAPRKHVAILGIVYAASLGIWYFASIEESKILSATLASLYIAIYLHQRDRWTRRGILLLTAALLAACLNEIVAGFLVIIPAADFLMRNGFDLRKGRWIFLHALTVPATLFFLEVVVNGIIAAPTENPENASHFSMFFYYLIHEYSIANLHIYLINFFFFNIAAPAPVADYMFNKWPMHPFYFEPALGNYLRFPAQTAVVVLFLFILAGTLWALWRRMLPKDVAICLIAVAAYVLLRCSFFYFIHPLEGMLFSNSASLANLLLLCIPFALSQLPRKQLLLGAFALALILCNGIFIAGKLIQ